MYTDKFTILEANIQLWNKTIDDVKQDVQTEAKNVIFPNIWKDKGTMKEKMWALQQKQ